MATGMGKSGRPDSATSIGLNVTLPCEARYLPILRRLAGRTADHLGYRTKHREDVVFAIEHAVLRVFEPGGTAYTHVELRMASSGSCMQVRIRYLGASLPRDGAPAIERLLSRSGPDGVPLDRLRRSMRTVVLGRGTGDDGADFCELTRALPEVSQESGP